MTLAKEGILDIHRSVLCTFRTSRFKIMNWIYRQCTGGLNYTTVLTKQHYITGSIKCSMKPLSKLFYQRSKPGFRVTVTLATHVDVNRMWILKSLKICCHK